MQRIFELVDANDGEGIRELLARDPGATEGRDETGVSPLARARYRGSNAAFDAILAAGEPTDPWDRLLAGHADGMPSPDAWSADGFTPLHLAALVDNVPAAAALLEAGAEPNVLAKPGYARVTPLGTCAFSGALGVARLLLGHGADPHLGEDGEYTVEAEATARGHEELARLIETTPAVGRREATR
jgi:ankyrin repeat protein